MINRIAEMLSLPKPLVIILLILILVGIILFAVYRNRKKKRRNAIENAYRQKMREEELDRMIRNTAKKPTPVPNKPYETSYQQETGEGLFSNSGGAVVKAHIIVQSGSTTKKYVVNISDELRIGKSDSNGIVIDEKWISETHCCFVNHEGTLYVHDMGSTNGTELIRKKQRVRLDNQEVKVMNGDEISLAGIMMTIYLL